MIDLKNFQSALEELLVERGIPKEKVLETIEMALAAAYKKDYGKKGQIVRAKFDSKSGKALFSQVKIVVGESMLQEAQKIKPDAALGEELVFPLETKEDCGRIAAQTAKQVIIQRIREAERESIFNEFISKQGEVVSGIVQRI